MAFWSGNGELKMNAVKSRSMRVATLFTGVAACAATGAVGANAQGTPQPAAGHSAKAVGLTVHPDGRTLSGSIREANCAGRSEWLHVLSTYGGLYCYGYAGEYSPTSETGMVSQCGGTNYGSLYVNDAKWISFGPGTTYRRLDYAHLDAVVIYSWSGTDKC